MICVYPQDRGKNNFGKLMVAITLRVMIGKEKSEVIFPEFLSPVRRALLAAVLC